MPPTPETPKLGSSDIQDEVCHQLHWVPTLKTENAGIGNWASQIVFTRTASLEGSTTVEQRCWWLEAQPRDEEPGFSKPSKSAVICLFAT